MSKFILGDTFIGDFPMSQLFGVNPDRYVQFGMKGHNGVDFACPSNTQIIAAADGWVKEVAFDGTGYGNYVKIIHDGYLTLYGHLDHAVVHVGDGVVRGQLIGLSDNTGNSTGPHMHFGVAPCDHIGVKSQTDNGYAGYVDPNGDLCQWDIKELTTPVDPSAKVEPPAPQSSPQPVAPVVTPTPTPSVLTPTPVPASTTVSSDSTITNLNQSLEQFKTQYINETILNNELNKQLTLKDTRITSLTTDYNVLLEENGKLKQANFGLTEQLNQAIHDRSIVLDAQGNQNRLMTMYKATSVMTLNRSAILRAYFSRFLHDLSGGGEKKNGVTTATKNSNPPSN